MNTRILSVPAPRGGSAPSVSTPRVWLRQSLQRHRALTVFGLLMWLAMLPALILSLIHI